jgi:RecA/RadA recombinase
MTKADKIKTTLLKEKAPEPKPLHLSTGSTLADLQLSGKTKGGLLAGHSYMFWGDSSSGKTLLAHNCLAEAAINPKFDDYRLILDNPQQGALFDLKRFWPKLIGRLEPPRTTKDGDRMDSETIFEFYANLERALLKLKRPCVYVLDDLDTLYHPGERDKFLKTARGMLKSVEDGRERKTKGSYDLSKAKVNSQNMSWVNSALHKTRSILIIIAQARDNIGFGAEFNPRTHGGGRATKFYATDEILTTVRGELRRDFKVRKGSADGKVDGDDKKKKIAVKQKSVGMIARIQVKKNRQTGDVGPVDVHFYRAFGLDDAGSMIQWLIEWGHWEGSNKHGEGKVNAPEFEWGGSKEGLVQKIIDGGLEAKLRNVVGLHWRRIEEETSVRRKSRYV